MAIKKVLSLLLSTIKRITITISFKQFKQSYNEYVPIHCIFIVAHII